MKKGFTLVELLATIVILGIVILIAIPSYNVISNNIKRKQNENKISYIETQAGKYVTESGLYSDIDQAYISVQTLLQNGYLDGDNKAGDKILDAYGNDITCYQIEVDFDKSKPEPKFIDEFVKNEDGICIYNDLKTKKLIRLDAYKTSSLSDDNKISIENNRTFWVKEDVLLKLNIIDEDLNNRRDQAIVKIDWNTVNDNKNYDQTQDNWYTIGWLDNVANFNSNNEYKNAYLVKTNKIMADTKFKISLIVNYIDDAGKKINEALTTYLIVRIDKENPTVTATVDTNWTKENKKIYITGNDKQGSGLNHFCIFDTEGARNCNPGTSEYVEIIGDKGNKGETLKPKGSYFIYAIDNVGNISDTAARVVVDNIDTTKPTCVYDNQNTTWKKGSQTITIKCEDGENGSGCITRPYKVTFDSAGVATSTTTLPSAYIITDYAGNKETCLGPVDIYLDNVPPVVSFGNNGDNTYRKAHSTKVTVSDEQNGTVTNLKYLWASSNTASAANGAAFTNGATITKSDGTGNFYLCIYSEDGIGNKATTCSNVFRFDNTPPVINITITGKVGTAAISDNVGLSGYTLTTSEQIPTSWNPISGSSYADSYTATVPNTYYYHAKDTLGNITTKAFVITKSAFCAYEPGDYWDFNYTGNIQEFEIPCDGNYKLEVWGAQGGNCRSSNNGGRGGYSVGHMDFASGKMLYIGVGGQGSGGTAGFNGGGRGTAGTSNPNSGRGQNGVSGGGATHIAYVTGTLANIGYNEFVTNNKGLIVAGGGGGAGGQVGWEDDGSSAQQINGGGSGGGTTGGNSADGSCRGTGANQSGSPSYWCAGSPGFGQGGNSSSGGGGGFYGGGGGYYAAGGGGSGWINGVKYGTMSNGQRSGNGFARITFEGVDPCLEINESKTFNYTGAMQEFRIKCNGNYKLEVWGGAGGTNSYAGGKGAYATGNINLTEGMTLYIGVGQAGSGSVRTSEYERWCYNTTYTAGSTFNGGAQGYASCHQDHVSYECHYALSGSGGGATHIGTFNNTLQAHASDTGLYLVAGGGGGGMYSHEPRENGGSDKSWGAAGSPACDANSGTSASYGIGSGPSGGGGYKGGAAGQWDKFGGRGGSCYVGGVSNGSFTPGNAEMPNPNGSGTMTGNSGNGVAKITRIG